MALNLTVTWNVFVKCTVFATSLEPLQKSYIPYACILFRIYWRFCKRLTSYIENGVELLPPCT